MRLHITTHLKHVSSHCVVKLMSERLILEIELHCSLTVSHLNQCKEYFNRSFRDWFQRMRLAELYFVAKWHHRLHGAVVTYLRMLDILPIKNT